LVINSSGLTHILHVHFSYNTLGALPFTSAEDIYKIYRHYKI